MPEAPALHPDPYPLISARVVWCRRGATAVVANQHARRALRVSTVPAADVAVWAACDGATSIADIAVKTGQALEAVRAGLAAWDHDVPGKFRWWPAPE